MPTKVGSGVGVGHVCPKRDTWGSERTLMYVLEMEGKSVGDAEFVSEAKKDWSQKEQNIFFSQEKEEEGFWQSAFFQKCFGHEGEKFFIFEFFCCWGGLN